MNVNTGQKMLMIENQGELNVKLVELLGASTKDGVDTIGVFGTGWKYGLALALRNGIGFLIYSGKKIIRFSTEEENISGMTFNRICYSVGKVGRKQKTSLTTKMGAADWTDEWMLLREVIGNALDEGKMVIRWVQPGEEIQGKKNKTRVFIEETPRIREVVDNLSMYVRKIGAIAETRQGALFNACGKRCRIYKKGIFVREMDKPSAFDYDLTELTLTESRSADSWNVGYSVGRFLTTLPVDKKKEVLKSVNESRASGMRIYEDDIQFYSLSTEDKRAWEDAFVDEFGDDAVLCQDSEVIKESVQNVGMKPVSLGEKFAEILRDGNVKTDKKVLGAGLSAGYVYKEITDYENGVLSQAQKSLSFILGSPVETGSFRIAKDKSPINGCEILLEESGELTFVFKEDTVEAGVRAVIEVAYAEALACLRSYGNRASTLENGIKKALFERFLPKIGLAV